MPAFVSRLNARNTLATLVGRTSRWILHDALHRGGSQLPGRIALAIDPQFIAHLRTKAVLGSIVVCGTNGKTTTTNVIASALEADGARVLCNRDGANMTAGVAAALLSGHAADWAVIEADELSTIHILPQLKPTYLILLNLFRDQLDRAGEIDHVQDTIVAALKASPQTTLVVCGDDPLCVGVAERARENGSRVVSFGVAEDLGLPPERVPEARFCQRCGAELRYTYRSYAQLGAFVCLTCGFARPRLDVTATRVEVGREGIALWLSGPRMQVPRRIHADFGGTYMIYNLLAAATACELAGADPTSLQTALDSYHPENGRLQHFVIDGREVTLNLAKNPTGLNQNLSLLLSDERSKAVCVVINDDFNDGRDISWLWDVDFERLAADTHTLRVLAGGHRANDLQVRLKYAGVCAPLVQSVSEALACVADLPVSCPLYMLTNYSALKPTKESLERLGEQHG